MAINPRQYQSGLVNVVGVNQMAGAANPIAGGLQQPQNPQLPVQDIKPPEYPQLPDVTPEKFQGMAQESEQRYQLVMESMKYQAGVRQAALAAKGVPKRQQELAGIFDGIASAGLKYLEYEKEKQAKKEEIEVQRNAMMARAALEELTIDAQGRIRQYGMENGIYTTREDVRKVLEHYSQVLPPDQMIPLYQFIGTEMRELEAQQTSRYHEAVEEQQNAQVNLVKAQLTYQTSAIVGAMSNPQLAQQQSDVLFNQAWDSIIQGTQGLDPTVRLEIAGDMLQTIASSATVTSGQRAAIEQRMADMQAWFPLIENELRPRYGDDPVQFKYALWATAPESLRGLVGDIPNNAEMARQIADELGTQQEIQNYYRQQQREQAFAQGIQPPAVKMGLETAYRALQGDYNAVAAIGLLENKEKDELLPHEVMALQYYTQWQADKKQYEELRSQLYSAETMLAREVSAFPVGSVPETQVYVDSATGTAYRLPVQNADGSWAFVNQDLTPEQREAAIAAVQSRDAERQRIQGEVQSILQRAASSGIDLTNPGNHAYLDLIYNELDQQQATQQFGSYETQAVPGEPQFGSTTVPQGPPTTPAPGSPNQWMQQPHSDLSGFNWSANEPPPGYPSGQTPVAPLARMDGSVIPFSHTREGQITVSSPYGMRTSPTSGQYRLHAGVDFASSSMYDEDVGAVTPAGGYVVAAFDFNGYGGSVLVQTPEGYIEQYSHLRNFFVKPGDQVRPGQPVGVVGGGEGDPMPGGSTGRHLHFQVWKPGTDEYTNPTENTIDALLYLEQLQSFEDVPRGTGAPPGQPSGTTAYMPTANATPDNRGNWYGNINAETFPYLTRFLQQGGGAQAFAQVPVEQVYQPSAPMNTGQLSAGRDAYPSQNNPTYNYGYTALGRDSEAARALAEVADEIGIPAVWLADLFHFESGGSWSVQQRGPVVESGPYAGERAIGPLQMMPGNLPAMGLTVDEVLNMSLPQYIRTIARGYLLPKKGQIQSIRQLASFVFTGQLNSSGDSNDGYNTLDYYVSQLGRAKGRSYAQGGDFQSTLGQTHETYQPGCTTCAQQINRFNAIIPHEVIR